MPKLSGIAMDDENALAKIVSLGENGVRKYFEDYMALRRIGFGHESHIDRNFIISDKAINFIDLNLNPAPIPDPDAALAEATRGLLSKFYKQRYTSEIERTDPNLQRELLCYVEKSLQRHANNKFAMQYLTDNNEYIHQILTKQREQGMFFRNVDNYGLTF
jgi:hypothetical protein